MKVWLSETRNGIETGNMIGFDSVWEAEERRATYRYARDHDPAYSAFWAYDWKLRTSEALASVLV